MLLLCYKTITFNVNTIKRITYYILCNVNITIHNNNLFKEIKKNIGVEIKQYYSLDYLVIKTKYHGQY